MLNLYIDESDCDVLTQAGKEPAICELQCGNCGDGLRFDQHRCATCGEVNIRYLEWQAIDRRAALKPAPRCP